MRATDATTGEALLIVGAGVAGLSLAIALGRAGIRVTVIDGASRPQTPADDRDINDWDLRVSALTPASVAFWMIWALGRRYPRIEKPATRACRFGMLRVVAVLILTRAMFRHPLWGTLLKTVLRCRRF